MDIKPDIHSAMLEIERLRVENESLKAEIRIIDRLLSKYMNYEYEPNEDE